MFNKKSALRLSVISRGGITSLIGFTDGGCIDFNKTILSEVSVYIT